MTQHDKLCEGIKAMGGTKLPKKNKYTMFRLGVHYYFVGKAGALRVSSRSNAATSVVCNDRFRDKVLNAKHAAAADALTSIGL